MRPCPSVSPHTCLAAIRRMVSQSGSHRPRAVEKTGPWKRWKTNPRFSTVPTAPWKTRKPSEFPTFPPLRRRFLSFELKPENLLRPAEEVQRDEKTKPDRSRVNKTGHLDLLPTALSIRRSRASSSSAVIVSDTRGEIHNRPAVLR